jgi:serine/threonine protein kinase
MERWRRTGRTIGAGGQAQVFVVCDQSGALSGEFALKLLTNANRAPRLDLEISTMKSLSRTGARVIEIVDDYITSEPKASRPWYVMPIANQGNLQDAIVANQCFGGSELTALRAFAQIVSAVSSVHAAGVAHRDLKPANILRNEGEIFLCDLGLCLPLGGTTEIERLTGALERIGALHYTPKEAFGMQPLDQKQYAFDAYALGKILYDLLAGRTLPGFIPPNDPAYDLLRVRGKRVYAGINAVLRGLLDDDPSARLNTLGALPGRIDSLIAWATETVDGAAEEGLRERLANASEALARSLVVTRTSPASPTLQQDCEALAPQIAALWANSSAITRMQTDLVEANSNILSMTLVNGSPHLRQLVSGPFIKTHRALEPLEELGYPTRPSFETGCAIGIVSKPEANTKLPQWWMECLIGAKAQDIYVGFGLVTRPAGIDSYTDVTANTVQVFKGASNDPQVIRRAFDYAHRLTRLFADYVAEQVASFASPQN